MECERCERYQKAVCKMDARIKELEAENAKLREALEDVEAERDKARTSVKFISKKWLNRQKRVEELREALEKICEYKGMFHASDALEMRSIACIALESEV